MIEQQQQCLWCGSNAPLRAGGSVTPINPQLSMPHDLRFCTTCGEAMLDIRLPDRTIRRKAREQKRRFRKSIWVIIYPIRCSWCNSSNTDAYEINATIANPISERLKYDIYRCEDCGKPSAISYLGEVIVHRADQDQRYLALWYLDPPMI